MATRQGEAPQHAGEGDAQHEALAQVGRARLRVDGFQQRKRHAHAQDDGPRVRHEEGGHGRARHEGEHQLARIGAGPSDEGLGQAQTQRALLHDGRHAEDAQYEPGGGRREAGKCIGQRGHHAQKDQKHDADESHDALRHGSAEPQRHRRQQHADGHDAFMGKTLESRHRAGGNHENCSQRRADHALDRERPLLEQLAGGRRHLLAPFRHGKLAEGRIRLQSPNPRCLTPPRTSGHHTAPIRLSSAFVMHAPGRAQARPGRQRCAIGREATSGLRRRIGSFLRAL